MKLVYLLSISIFIHALTTLVVPEYTGAEDVEFDGIIEPYRVIQVGSGVAGLIESVTVDRGEEVKEGQVLARLQSGVEKATMELARVRAELEATIKAKETELEFAERNRERSKDLYDKKALPFHEWDEVKTKRKLAELGLAEARESMRLAELELNRTIEVVKRMTIRSPVTGVVVERYLSPGEYVENQPIMKLAQIDPLNVEIIMPVEMFGTVRIGMLATVKPEAPISGTFTAKVTIVDRVVDAASGTFGVRLELPNPDYSLPSGLKCKVTFLSRDIKEKVAQQ